MQLGRAIAIIMLIIFNV